MVEPLRAAQPAVNAARAWALALLAALVMLGGAWELWLAPTGSGTLAVKVLPLLLCAPGLARHRLFTYRWLSLLVWLYLLEGLVRATSEPAPGAVLAGLEIVLGLALFGVCSFYIRRRLRAARAEALPA